MNLPEEHAASLRAIGYLLDSCGARRIAVEEKPDGVSVSWNDGPYKVARYPWGELGELQRVALANRTAEQSSRQTFTGHTAWSELLRTLGQDLDQRQAAFSVITGDLNWLTASWTANGHYSTHQYTTAELWEASARRAAARRAYA